MISVFLWVENFRKGYKINPLLSLLVKENKGLNDIKEKKTKLYNNSSYFQHTCHSE